MDDQGTMATYIQPHGVLLVLDNDLKVIQYSENLSKLLEIPLHQILVTPIANFLHPVDPKDDVMLWLKEATNQYKQVNWNSKQKNIKIWVYILRTEQGIILELEPIKESIGGTFDISQYVLDSTRSSINPKRLEPIFQQTCTEIKKITGFDHVVIYQFQEKDKASVIVGAAGENDQSFLGLYFPDNFIPASTKEAFLRLPIRYIPDINATEAEVLPAINAITQQPLDLSYSNLRPIVGTAYKEFLSSMGVISANTVAIIQDNKLWGLIACYHKEVKYLSVNFRLIITLIATTLAKQIFAIEHIKASKNHQRMAVLQAKLVENVTQEESLIYALDRHHNHLMNLVNATGMSVYFHSNLFNYGKTPSDAQTLDLIKWLSTHHLTSTATDCLPLQFTSSKNYKDKACGLLVVPITAMENNYLLFYRPEIIRSIKWANDPTTAVHRDQTSYFPREASQHTIETITDHSEPWTEQEIAASHFIRNLAMRKQLQDILQVKAMFDPLTGLFNYLYLDEQLKIELFRARRESKPLSLMHINLMNLKNIHETVGQQASDAILATAANVLKASFRGYDYIYRLSSEEFLILLPGMSQPIALERAKLLQNNIGQLTIQFNNNVLPHLISCIGIATYPEHANEAETFIAAAKTAMNQAKTHAQEKIAIAHTMIGTK